MQAERRIIVSKSAKGVILRRDKEARLKEMKKLKDLALEMARRIEMLEKDEQAA